MPAVLVGALRMYYERHGPDSGTPVVLVMGLGGDSTAWGLQLAALAPRRPCVVFDNRGTGQTDAPDRPYTIREMAGDLLGLLDALALPRVHLLGLSMGGAIAQEAALAAPERVVSLQLHATWPATDAYLRAVTEAARRARPQLGREGFLRTLLPWLFTPACYATRPQLIEQVIEQTLASPHPQPLHGYLQQAAAVIDHDARDRLAGIRCPTLHCRERGHPHAHPVRARAGGPDPGGPARGHPGRRARRPLGGAGRLQRRLPRVPRRRRSHVRSGHPAPGGPVRTARTSRKLTRPSGPGYHASRCRRNPVTPADPP